MISNYKSLITTLSVWFLPNVWDNQIALSCISVLLLISHVWGIDYKYLMDISWMITCHVYASHRPHPVLTVPLIQCLKPLYMDSCLQPIIPNWLNSKCSQILCHQCFSHSNAEIQWFIIPSYCNVFPDNCDFNEHKGLEILSIQ